VTTTTQPITNEDPIAQLVETAQLRVLTQRLKLRQGQAGKLRSTKA
jgi:hypothetical protein